MLTNFFWEFPRNLHKLAQAQEKYCAQQIGQGDAMRSADELLINNTDIDCYQTSKHKCTTRSYCLYLLA